jgi:V/A-type H+-transporting ATPase subunit E
MILPVDKGAQLIAEDILEEAKSRAAEIISAAKREAQTMLAATRLGLKEEEELELRRARLSGRSVYEEMLAGGRLRAKRELLEKREQLIKSVIEAAEKEIRAYASSDKYGKELVKIAVDACKKLGSSRVVIQANSRDLKALEKSKVQIAKELGGTDEEASVSFGEPIQATGGVLVRTMDGKVEIDETFDGRMKREFDALRVKVAKVLFEGSK